MHVCLVTRTLGLSLFGLREDNIRKKIDTLDALEDHKEHDDDYQANAN